MLPKSFSFPQSLHWISDWRADLQAHSRVVSFYPILSPSPRVLHGQERPEDCGRFPWSRSGRLLLITFSYQMCSDDHKETGKCSLTWAQSEEGSGFSGIQHFSATTFWMHCSCSQKKQSYFHRTNMCPIKHC